MTVKKGAFVLKNNELDHIDKEILVMLQENARMSLKEIAQRVYLSSPAVSVRIDNLVEKGYIEGFHAQINTDKMGYHIKAFINLEVSPVDKQEFYPYIKSCKNVIECNCVTGDYSMLLEVLFPSTDELDQFIGELQKYGRTKTLIVFSTSVEHRGLYIDTE
ncbi:MAG: Lrp/AsnC family transcriptional regulator [Clostridiaceae bacterium]|nr:Lrp/AsnC family transcriptional regulator [Clostridiaceae bacterium]